MHWSSRAVAGLHRVRWRGEHDHQQVITITIKFKSERQTRARGGQQHTVVMAGHPLLDSSRATHLIAAEREI